MVFSVLEMKTVIGTDKICTGIKTRIKINEYTETGNKTHNTNI